MYKSSYIISFDFEKKSSYYANILTAKHYRFLIPFFLFILLIANCLCAQNYDSLYQSIEKQADDTIKVKKLNDLAYRLRKNNADLAIKIADESTKLANSINYTKGIITAEKTLGLSYGYGKEKDLALEHYLIGLNLAKDNNLQKEESDILNNLGNLYFINAKFDTALKYYSESLKIRRKINDLKGMSSTLGNMGNIANAKLKDLDLALKYYNESLEISMKIGKKESISTTLNNISNIHRSRRQYKEAMAAQKKALEIDRKKGDLFGMTYAYSGIVLIYSDLEKYDSALYYALKLKNVADSLNSLTRKRVAYMRLTSLFEKMGDYKKALEYRKNYQNLSDSLRIVSTESKIAEIEAKYQNKIQTKEVEMLRNENEFNQQKIRNQYKERIIWALLSVILIGGLRLLWLQVKKNKTRNQRLSNQKDELVKKSEEINRINQIIQRRNQELNETLSELRNTQDKLLETEKIASISVLTAGLAHELNNPLNYVSGVIKPIKLDLEELSNCLDKEASSEAVFLISEMNELLSSLSEGVDKVTMIIKNLVDISPKIYPDQKRAFELSKIIEAAIYVIQKSNSNVEIAFKVVEELVVFGDYAELNQVFLNLLKNSLDALKEIDLPKITITLDRIEEVALICIKDNGMGMDQETTSKIFQPFYTTKEPGKGTGLGLYISYGIIKKYDGEITVESTIGSGTEFSIQLPLSKEAVVLK